MKIPNPFQYLEEKKAWRASGEPMRSPERVAELYEVCKACDNFIEIMENVGQCGKCSCFLRPEGELGNKLAWATTRCPLEEPKWIEEEGIKKETAIAEAKSQSQTTNKGGCGC